MNHVRLPPQRPLSRARHDATVRELRRLPRRRRTRWSTTLALAGALVLLSAVAAVGYALIAPQERFGSLGCYDKPSLDADVAVVSTSDRDPTDVCRELWTTGGVGGPDVAVPDELTACVLAGDDAIGVFPDDADVCAALGLQPLDDVEITPEDTSVVRLREALHERVPSPDAGGECIGTAEALRRAEEALNDADAQDWTVTSQGREADGDMRCAVEQMLDVRARKVVLGGIPGPRSAQWRVAQRLTSLAEDSCLTDRDDARVRAKAVLSDLGLIEWTVQVEHDIWDANAGGTGLEGHPRCAVYQISGRTVRVESVIREPEPLWRRFVPWL